MSGPKRKYPALLMDDHLKDGLAWGFIFARSSQVTIEGGPPANGFS